MYYILDATPINNKHGRQGKQRRQTTAGALLAFTAPEHYPGQWHLIIKNEN